MSFQPMAFDFPASRGYRFPAEWEPHRATWLAWPYQADWDSYLDAAKAEIVGLAEALSRPSVAATDALGQPPVETLRVLVSSSMDEEEVRSRFSGLPFEVVTTSYGDIWMRDTMPLFLAGGSEPAASCFSFNGWGQKYCYEGDDSLSVRTAKACGVVSFRAPCVLEGGAIEVDGCGTLLTTRPCLVDAKRNPGKDERELEQVLSAFLGVERVIWLDQGLANDHTDGHIDTLARFVRPGLVVCMEPRDDDDPNREALRAIVSALRGARDARGQLIEVATIPSPGRVVDAAGRVMPASYANFYIGNRAVVVPTYGSRWDDEAVRRLEALFPDRRVVGAPAKAILTGGGAFHCITQQQPATLT